MKVRGARGATLIEVLITASILLGFLLIVMGITRFSRRATEDSIESNVDLQAATQKALVVLIADLEECIEFARPAMGTTLTYFMARSKLNEILLGYQELDPEATSRAGRPLYQLCLYRHDPSNPAASTRETVISQIERLTFTSRSPGLLQVHMKLHDSGHTYTLLTTVRARGISSEANL